MPDPRSANYYSYLLRLWKDDQYTGWRASLQSVATGEQHIFADMALLLAFLQARTRDESLDETEGGEISQRPYS